MSNQEILEKAIRKAMKYGFTISEWEIRGNGVYLLGEATEMRLSFCEVIFNHDFAKALWGEDEHEYDYHSDDYRPSTNWQYHLQQMVVAANPIDYLGAHL